MKSDNPNLGQLSPPTSSSTFGKTNTSSVSINKRAQVLRDLSNPSTRGGQNMVAQSLPANFYKEYRPPPTPRLKPQLPPVFDDTVDELPSFSLPPSWKASNCMPQQTQSAFRMGKPMASPSYTNETHSNVSFSLPANFGGGFEMQLASRGRGQMMHRFGRTFFRKNGSRTDLQAGTEVESKSDDPSDQSTASILSMSSASSRDDDKQAPVGSMTLISLLPSVNLSDIRNDTLPSQQDLPEIPLIPLNHDLAKQVPNDTQGDSGDEGSDDMFAMDDI